MGIYPSVLFLDFISITESSLLFSSFNKCEALIKWLVVLVTVGDCDGGGGYTYEPDVFPVPDYTLIGEMEIYIIIGGRVK